MRKNLYSKYNDKTTEDDNEENRDDNNFYNANYVENYGEVYIKLLRIVSWIELAITIISSMYVWAWSRDFFVGCKYLFIGITIFALLMTVSFIAENIAEIRKIIEEKNHKNL